MGCKLKAYSNKNLHSTYPVSNNLLLLKYFGQLVIISGNR